LRRVLAALRARRRSARRRLKLPAAHASISPNDCICDDRYVKEIGLRPRFFSARLLMGQRRR
jgi:hypothetical protein